MRCKIRHFRDFFADGMAKTQSSQFRGLDLIPGRGMRPRYCPANRRGKDGSCDRFPLLGLQNYGGWWRQPWNQKVIILGRKVVANLYSVLKSRDLSEAKSLSPVWLFGTPVDCSLWGSSIHGIFQARVLEWVAVSFSRGSSQPRDWIRVSSIASSWFYCLSPQGSSVLIHQIQRP